MFFSFLENQASNVSAKLDPMKGTCNFILLITV